MRRLNASEKKQIVENYKKMFKRANFNGYLYLAILKNNLNEYIECKNNSDALYRSIINTGEWLSKYYKLKNKMQNAEPIIIAFATMFLECLIWDYLAVNTTQKIAKDYLGKMSLIGKWEVVPKLVNNDKNISIDREAISLLKKLVKERNDIVHSKSKTLPDNYEEHMEYISELSQGRSITPNEAYQCVIDCTDGLKKIDATDYWFFKDNAWDSFKNA